MAFHNIGSTDIKLIDPTLEVWISKGWESQSPVAHLDPKWLTDNGKMHIQLPIVDLEHSYTPGTDDKVGINFAVEAAPGNVALFYVTFPVIEGTGGKDDWTEYQWDWVCEDPGVKELP